MVLHRETDAIFLTVYKLFIISGVKQCADIM